MQNAKASLFLFLTPRQKSQLLGTLKAYFKKFPDLALDDICYKFLEDEKYYLDINNPHFEFMREYLNDDKFFSDMKKYLSSLEFEKEQKELLKPYLDKQKELMKAARKRAQEFKMSKLKPTKKQLNYYDKIARAHGVQKRNTESASRLDLRNWIMEILDDKDN